MKTSSTNDTCREFSLFSEATDLKRELGLPETVSIVIGRIIGSGIFRTPGPIMALVLSTSLFGFVWLLGGIITIFAAVCYAELGGVPNRAAPMSPFARISPVWAFLRAGRCSSCRNRLHYRH